MNPQQTQQQYPYPNIPPYIYPPNPPQYIYPPIIPQYIYPQQHPQYPYPPSNPQHTYPLQNPYPYPQHQPQSQYPYPYPYPPQQQQQQYSNFTQQPQPQHTYPPQQIPTLIPQPPGIIHQNNYPPQQVNHPNPPNPPPLINKIPAVESRNEGCNICKKNHLAKDCWEKSPAVRRERARIEGLCFICLNKNKHRSGNCKFNHLANMYICQECPSRALHAKNLCLNFRNPNSLPEQNITPVREKSRIPIAVAPQKPRGYLYRSASKSTIGYDEEEEYDREESSEEEEEKMEVEEAQEKKEKESPLRRSKSLPTM